MTLDFSVVLPTRRDSPHLRASLASVLAQDATLEILLVHSRDPDEPPLPPELEADSRVRRLEATPTGASRARNAGLDGARGRFVAFLDDDDLWLPGHLARAAAAFDRYNAAVLVGGDSYFFADPSPDGDAAAPSGLDELPRHRPDLARGPVAFAEILLGNPWTTPAVVLDRTRLRASDRFDPALTHHEDWDLWLRLADDRTAIHTAEPSALVRRRPGSLSRDRRAMAETGLRVLEAAIARAPSAALPPPALLRRRVADSWHEIAWASLVADEADAARVAAREAIRRRPSRVKNWVYLALARGPAVIRRALFAPRAGERA